MRVAMVYPEMSSIAKFGQKRKEFPPFGVMYLAACVELQGIDVEILSASRDRTDLDLKGYEAIAFSTPSSVTYPLIKQTRFDSVYDGSPLIAVGGVHASLYPKQTLIDMEADVVGVGEGEITMLEILDAQESRDFSGIEGVYYWDEKNLVFTSSRPLIEDIDSLPIPARHLMDVENIVMNDRLATTDLRMTHIMLSRGCPFSCHFCASPQKVVQYRSGESVRRELVGLIDDYGIEGFSVVDDNSILKRDSLHDICRSIEELELRWSTVSRVDTVDSEILRRMKKAGCIEIAYGMESGSQIILDAMNKGISVEQIRSAVNLTHEIGIGVKVFVVHGFPGENLETTQSTIDLLEELADKIQRVSLFRFVPLPGSFVYDNQELYGIHAPEATKDGSTDWDHFHIHHNERHWWGTVDDFRTLNTAYDKLRRFIRTTWSSRFEYGLDTDESG